MLDKQAMKVYDDEKRAERFEQARIRREIADSQLQKKKLLDLKHAKIKQDKVDKRRNVGLNLHYSMQPDKAIIMDPNDEGAKLNVVASQG